MAESVEVDTGQPIAELADIAEEPSPGFLRRLWGRIDRRRLGGDLADLTWQGVLSVVIEYLGMVLEVLKVQESPAEPADDDKGEKG